jgi:hypothetical protein
MYYLFQEFTVWYDSLLLILEDHVLLNVSRSFLIRGMYNVVGWVIIHDDFIVNFHEFVGF